MKFKSMFAAFMLKALLIITCITVGFSGFTTCGAQSIIGKWKGVSVKNYYGVEGAKMMGKSMDEKTAKELGDSWGEYKPDHTFIISFATPNSSDVMTMKGTWSVTGNQLKLTLEPQYNPQNITTTATFSITGNTMVTTAVMPPPSRISKTISTSVRM